MARKCIIQLNTFQEDIQLSWKQLEVAKEFSDVTLACGKKEFQAHRAVICDYSSIFKNILKQSGGEVPFIYFSGTSNEELENLLHFMYHGEVSIGVEGLKRFMELAEDLQIKGLTGMSQKNKAVLFESANENSTSVKQQEGETRKRKKSEFKKDLKKQEGKISHADYLENVFKRNNFNNSNLSNSIEEYNKTDGKNNLEHGLNFDVSIEMSVKSENQIEGTIAESHKKEDFICDKCLKNFSNKSHLKRHIESIHEGIQYPCDICNFVARQKSNLHTHTKKYHSSEDLQNNRLIKLSDNNESSNENNKSQIESSTKQEGKVSLAEYLDNISKKEEIDDTNISNYIEEYNNADDINNLEYPENISEKGNIEDTNISNDIDDLSNMKENVNFNESLETPAKKVKYENHIKGTISTTDKKDFTCEKCLKNFSYKSHLKRHIESIHDGIQHPCSFCNFTATQKGHLHIHTKKHHSERLLEQK